MKVTILNGNPEPSAFDTYIGQVNAALIAQGHTVTHFNLRDLKLSYCIGCFGCWTKTPGECSNQDQSDQVQRAVIHADFVLWAAPLQMGFPSALLKTTMDKFLPLIHPYFEVVNNEAHHRPRYAHYPLQAVLVAPEADTDREDLSILQDIFSRMSLNFKSRLVFLETTERPVEQITATISNASQINLPLPERLPATQGVRIDPPKHLTVFNGSPRGAKGNTPIVLGKFLDGFTSLPGRSFEMHQVNKIKDREQHLQAFAEAECVLIGHPLYTDAMPGVVKDFIESLAPLRGRANNPPVGFLVQSGFPEAGHSRYEERYLQKLAARLGSPYLGTIVKGGVEGIQIMTDNMTQKLYTALTEIGITFGQQGIFDPQLLRKLARPEHYPRISVPFFKLFSRLPLSSFYWDSQLKKNGVYEKRFAQPYAEETS